MNVASLELCKELHELSGWNDKKGLRQEIYFYEGSVVNSSVMLPRYDLGYLLRKLPFNRPIAKGMAERWIISRYNEEAEPVERIWGDTPEDATCRLAIELFKKGVLK